MYEKYKFIGYIQLEVKQMNSFTLTKTNIYLFAYKIVCKKQDVHWKSLFESDLKVLQYSASNPLSQRSHFTTLYSKNSMFVNLER